MITNCNETAALITAIKEQRGFNYICEGRCYTMRNTDAREIIKELLYAIETADIFECEKKAIFDTFIENITEV